MRSFILIAFKFPPYSGVGGFRWSKLCKYLALQGHEMHVITVKWRNSGPNTLIEDVEHPNIKIHRIPSGYLHNLRFRKFRKSLLNSIRKKSFDLLDRCFFFDDYAQHWGIYLLPFCKKLIKERNVDVVVATGHPFQSIRWASEIKRQNSGIKLIQDFRDPWIHPYKKFLSERHVDKIESWKRFSVGFADHCVFVTNGLGEVILDKVKRPYSVITNGHDIQFSPEQKYKQDQWIHAGNLAYGRDFMARSFLDAIRADPELLENCVVKFYGKIPEFISGEYSDLMEKGLIICSGIASQEKVFDELQRSKVALHFGSEKFPYALSTKIFENSAAGVPTLSINGGGEIEELINQNNWGISVRPVSADIREGIKKISKDRMEIGRDTVEQYHYRNLAFRYSRLINEI